MGSVGSQRSELYHHINMKFLVAFSAVLAMVYAEADPYLLGYGGYGLGYAGLGYAGIGYAGLKSAPCVNAANVPVPCNLHYGKREAEAKPYLGYGLGYAGIGYAGIGLKSAPCVNAANVPVPCASGLGLVHAYGKREAEAEPFYGYGYAGLGYAGLGYGYGIHSSHVGLCTNYLGAAVPC